jgi:hypothetical protein
MVKKYDPSKEQTIEEATTRLITKQATQLPVQKSFGMSLGGNYILVSKM